MPAGASIDCVKAISSVHFFHAARMSKKAATVRCAASESPSHPRFSSWGESLPNRGVRPSCARGEIGGGLRGDVHHVVGNGRRARCSDHRVEPVGTGGAGRRGCRGWLRLGAIAARLAACGAWGGRGRSALRPPMTLERAGTVDPCQGPPWRMSRLRPTQCTGASPGRSPRPPERSDWPSRSPPCPNRCHRGTRLCSYRLWCRTRQRRRRQ